MGCDAYKQMAQSMGIDCSKFTPEEQEKISAKIETLMGEGKTQDEAIAIAIDMVTAQAPTPDTVDHWPQERPEVTGDRVDAARTCSTWGDVSVCFMADDEPLPNKRPIQIGPFKGILDTDAGRMTLFDVPVFVTCKRGKHDFNEAWLRGAVDDALRGECDGYLPPMHVKHHGATGDTVESAGLFRMKRVEVMPYKGEPRLTILADMIYTKPSVIGDVIANRLPYRSVEIYDAKEKKIDSLALLDHEAPFLELPMTADVSGESVEPSTFSQPFDVSAVVDQGPVVAFFSRGSRFAVLMENDIMPSDYRPVHFQKDDEEEEKKAAETTEAEPTPEGAPAGDEETALPDEAAAPDAEPEAIPEAAPDAAPEQEMLAEEAGPDTSWMEPEAAAPVGPIDAEAIVTAILEGTISIKDFHSIQNAMATVESAMHPAEEPKMEGEPTVDEGGNEVYSEEMEEDRKRKAPPAAAPAEAMQRQITPDHAAVMARLDAAEQKIAQREEEDSIREDTEAAAKTLDGRLLGENPIARLTTFRREHGKEAFAAYVKTLDDTLPHPMSGRFNNAPGSDAFDFGAPLPDEVMAFQKHGTEAVERASRFAREYQQLKERRMVNVPLDRYLEIQMTGITGLTTD